MSKRKDTAAPVDRDEYAATLAAELPAEGDELLAVAAAAVGELHAAVLECDGAGAESAAQRYEACVWKLNGGTFFGSTADESAAGCVIERHCRAEPGLVPMWGQRGEFLIVVDGIRALVDFDAGYGLLHCHFAFHAVDLDRPFISETGYRSHFETAQGGMTVDQVAAAVFGKYLAEKNGRVMIDGSARDRLADDALPRWLDNLDPPASREPATLPAGYVLVDVILPPHQAFIARKWAEAAHKRLGKLREAAQAAKAERVAERREAAKALAEDTRKKQGEADGRIALRGRYRVTRVHHPVFERDVGKVVIVDRFAGLGMVWAHDDKPVTYRTNRAGRRVVAFDPTCVQSLYHMDDLEPAEGEADSKIK
ncbi:klcB [Burkholderia vietnamiensis]|uniref:klcB n=1 Tax=Burkholderia vietnamiensis TaxID=60552 RepID=UPI001B9D2BFF|nr:klcB [Burkholderia vietnamiensis]MBR8087077.1 klcB [Burkholderia vietnamiensis]